MKRQLTNDETRRLEAEGCRCNDWTRIRVSGATDLRGIRNVYFSGDVTIGELDTSRGECLRHCKVENCSIGDRPKIRNIGDALRNCRIGKDVSIVNCGLVEFRPGATCGVGTRVDVLDETGSRPVTIYPGITAQTATLMARMPEWNREHLQPLVSRHIEDLRREGDIGDGARLFDCGTICDVFIDREVRIYGARCLRNGSVVNNARPGECRAYVGDGVDARNFIIEDGVVDSNSILVNCYVGQGSVVERGFSAHDSLFFANCRMENGEACALFAGPYTASMHKSSLLISCQTSFFNAGSGSNQSNHMYKLGPQYWGVLERGVKTSSGSYIMFGAHIGAFSLVMGQHKSHPDSSQFPFSYLFGDSRGYTVLVPAMMLRSCGLTRDEQKWPQRDVRRESHLPEQDRIIFDVFNPLTVDKMLGAISVIKHLLESNDEEEHIIRYKGMKMERASLERALEIYRLAIYKYLSIRMNDSMPASEDTSADFDWTDVGGLLMRRDWLQRALTAESLKEMEGVFTEAFDRYRAIELQWLAARLPAEWRKPREVIAEYASRFDKMVDDDRQRTRKDLKAQDDMLAL